MSYESELSESDRKFAGVLACVVLVIVSLSLLLIAGFAYQSLENRMLNRLDVLARRVHTLEVNVTGISSYKIWNFEKNKLDTFIGAGTIKVQEASDSPIIPVFVSESFFEKSIEKVRQRTLELVEQNRVVEPPSDRVKLE